MDSEKNECQTILRYGNDRLPIYTNKHKFESHDSAVQACKEQNSKPNQIHKLVTYKCRICHKFHIGRNGKMLDKKYKNKLKASLTPNKVIGKPKFKLIGKIDLSKF